MNPNPTSKNLSISSLILGISALLTSLMFVGFFLGLIAIVLGKKALKREQGRKLAITGITTGSIGVLLSVISAIVIFGAVPSLQNSQRETMRKNDLSLVASSIGQYQTENAGTLPSADEIITQEYENRFLVNETNSEGVETTIITSGDADENSILYTPGRNCEGKTGSRAYSLVTLLKNGEEYCLGSL